MSGGIFDRRPRRLPPPPLAHPLPPHHHNQLRKYSVVITMSVKAVYKLYILNPTVAC